MRREDLPVDYEALTPGFTGYYRNIVTYPQIVADWNDDKLIHECAIVMQLLVTQPRIGNNAARIALMEQADTLIGAELLRRNSAPSQETTMSERDAQAKVLYESMVPGYLWERVEPEAHRQFWLAQADVLIAAGYRRIPDDCVVVNREQIQMITDYWYDRVRLDFKKVSATYADLDSALTATRHGEDQ